MASRKLTDLHPALQDKASRLVSILEQKGIDLLIYCTWRSNNEQAELYAQGRTRAGKIVTWARPGESLHNYTRQNKPCAMAFDCVPLVNSKPHWTLDALGTKLWATVAQEAKALGLEWGGDWSGAKRESPHFQLNKETIKNEKMVITKS